MTHTLRGCSGCWVSRLLGDKCRSGEPRKDVTAIIQTQDDGVLDWGGEGGEWWMNLEYSLWVEVTGFADKSR